MTGITYSDETPFEWIARHNRDLIAKIQEPHFDGDRLLDPTLNGAEWKIHAANEMVVKYPQGAFPLEIAQDAIESTYLLLSFVEKLYAREKIKPMSQKFRRMIQLWYYAGPPIFPPEIFSKKIFRTEAELFGAMEKSNCAMIIPCPAAKRIVEHKSKSEMSGLSQEQVALDFGISRKTLIRWEQLQSVDGPENTSNKFGYYKSLRTNPDLRSAYNLLSQIVRMYFEQCAEAKRKGRPAITFCAFNEAFHKRML